MGLPNKSGIYYITNENLVKTTISHKLAGSRNNNTPYRYL